MESTTNKTKDQIFQEETQKRLFDILDKIVSQPHDSCSPITVLKSIHTILDRILKDPLDVKLQKLNTSAKIFQNQFNFYSNIQDVFSFFGFTKETNDQGQYLVFKGKVFDLKTNLYYYEKFLMDRKFVKSDFDPYSCYITGPSAGQNKIVGSLPEWNRLLNEEKERRKKIIEESISCDRNTLIFNSNEISIESTFSSEDTVDKKQADQDFMNYAKAILKESRDDKFKIKARIEFEKLTNEKLHTKSIIHLKFQDGFVLQGHFALQEKVGDIYDFLHKNLKEELSTIQDKISIHSMYPSKKYTNLSKTIFEEGLYPNAALYVIVDDKKFTSDFLKK